MIIIGGCIVLALGYVQGRASLAAQALTTVHESILAEREVRQVVWLNAYGAGEATVSALLLHGNGGDRDVAEVGCSVLAEIAGLGECRPALLASGAADAALRMLADYCDDESGLDYLVWGMPTLGGGVLVNGSAFMPLLKCLTVHTADADIVLHNLSAVGTLRLVALLPPSCHIDAVAVAKLLTPLVQTAVAAADADEALDALEAEKSCAMDTRNCKCTS